MREISKWFHDHESAFRRSLAIVGLLAIAIYFSLEPGWWVRRVVGIIAGTCYLGYVAFYLLDHHREANRKPRSPKVRRIEWIVGLTIWLAIGAAFMAAYLYLDLEIW